MAKPKTRAGKARKIASKPAVAGVDLYKLEDVVEILRPSGIGPVAKGVVAIRQNAILRRIEAFWNRLNAARKEKKLRELMALRELKGGELVQAFVKMGERDKTLRDPADLGHATQEWLGSYFKGPVVEMFVEGMIVAAQRSLATGVPIGMYWVAGAGKQMKVAVAQSGAQITFLLMTPPQPAVKTPVKQLERPESLWVVSGSGKRAVTEQVYPTALVL
jgi:hypothetical protein